MQLKPQDLKTFETYKKAMRLAASQIKDNTKFCMFNEVHLPDANGKPHVLKPFLVVGSGQIVTRGLLLPLKGAKKLVCEGTCSLAEGKIAFQAPKVPYGKLRAQAMLFKELLAGKTVLIPAGAKDEDEEEEESAEPATQPPVAQSAKPANTAPQPSAAKIAPPPPPPKTAPTPPPPPDAKATAAPAAKTDAPPAAEPHHVKLAKASLHWHSTRSIMDGQCKALKQAVRGHYANHHPAVLQAIDNNVHKIDGLLGKLDHRLADSLKQASAAPTDAARAAELRNATVIVNEYIRYVKSEPLIAHMDQNPFGVKCNLRQTLSSALNTMIESITNKTRVA